MTSDIDPVLAERVQTGIDVLDEAEPGWLESIDLEHLDLNSSCMCVLGQIYGTFDIGVEQLDESTHFMPWEMGFDVNTIEVNREVEDLALDLDTRWTMIRQGYEALDRAWKTAILARRLGGTG